MELIQNGRLHGFVACHHHEIIGFCNADLKENYFRLSKENDPDSWVGIDGNERVLAIVCFTIAPEHRGKGIAKRLLEYACGFAGQNGYSYVESYPSEGEFNPYNCCGNRSMYEGQGFSIMHKKDGIIARKKMGNAKKEILK